MDTRHNEKRNYNDISPSAKSLVLLKGLTNIPFARETAALISHPEKYVPEFDNTDLAFWKRVVHFEMRYWSIDQLLSELAISNILELSSGFSFRGLDTVSKKKVFYIDTDLEELIASKKVILQSLHSPGTNLPGKLELSALNALNENEFIKTVNTFPPGAIVIVNEGLLMYLGEAEKIKLCQVIRKVLTERGGYWITGDIYRRSTLEKVQTTTKDNLKELVDRQKIEENMFDNFQSAETFFSQQGFTIDKVAKDNFSKISSLQYLMRNATSVQLQEMQSQPKIQETWRLKVKDGL